MEGGRKIGEVKGQNLDQYRRNQRPNAIAYNNGYLEERWGAFRHAGAMRLITSKARSAGVELPSSPLDPKCKACPAYHIKGMYSVIEVSWMLTAGLLYYEPLGPSLCSPKAPCCTFP